MKHCLLDVSDRQWLMRVALHLNLYIRIAGGIHVMTEMWTNQRLRFHRRRHLWSLATGIATRANRHNFWEMCAPGSRQAKAADRQRQLSGTEWYPYLNIVHRSHGSISQSGGKLALQRMFTGVVT